VIAMLEMLNVHVTSEADGPLKNQDMRLSNYISQEFVPYDSKQVSIAVTQDLHFTKWKL
jgi:hypothetical protein